MVDLSSLTVGIQLPPPDHPPFDDSVPHAPKRPSVLSEDEFKLAVQNALRYFPAEYHEQLMPEFVDELRNLGHIYMLRYRPTAYAMKAYDVEDYLKTTRCRQAACIQLMIMNNLDPAVAQFPHEIITYGGNGSVFSNWAQYHLAMKYLSEMTDEQTLVMYSGHPLGLFPSHKDAPRVIVTNGMVIPNYSSKEMYEKMYAQGVTQYGQMTAGSYCYIGPQGIVHGTTITVLNAARKYLNRETLDGIVFLTAGLGGMSGAQPKAATIAGCIGIVAEVDYNALKKRYDQGWVNEMESDIPTLIARVKKAKKDKEVVSIGFHGNVVSLWEAFAEEEEDIVELGSDQTSLHNPYLGGYYPVSLTFEESRAMMRDNPKKYKEAVQDSLRRHAAAINKLTTNKGLHFFDYGNAFLVECYRANADIMVGDSGLAPENGGKFRYDSYVQAIMGDVFSLGFGPFRWVCCSGDPTDLATTDRIAAEVFEELMPKSNEKARQQYADNLKWIREAGKNKMVVGSEARILYSNCEGRARLALEFNKAVREGKLRGMVVLSRDHHDVSGTDSPYRETSNITDGSMFCADMAIQNVLGDAARGATWVSIHNGGGCGWGEVINGGFGMVLDGTADTDRRCSQMLHWDVCNGVSRRSWAGNDNAMMTIKEEMERNAALQVTMPTFAENKMLEKFCAEEPRPGCDTVFVNCNVATMKEGEGVAYGMIADGVVGIKDGEIKFVGKRGEGDADAVVEGAEDVKDLEGRLVTPGLIDCHTHVIYGGNRSKEWELKLKGASYEEVAKAGGGIVNTVKGTREGSVASLVAEAAPRLKSMLSEGVTTIEIKSGYGLEEEAERKMLQAATLVEKDFGVKVQKTFLGAHAVPVEYTGRDDEYMEECIRMMRSLNAEGIVDAVDCFTESIGFTVVQTEKLFTAAKELGLKLRLHGDQLNDFGCGALASKFSALSCDHCEYCGEEAIDKMAEGGTVAVLLPTANYFISEKKLPDVAYMRTKKVDMALGTNCNPGSSPCCSLLLVMNMACTRFRMSPEEALRGVTLSAAKAIGLQEEIGSLEAGKKADLCVWDASEPAELSYYMGLNLLKECYVDGVLRK
ncbi:hypothetical protein TrVE_jg8985 [Triparma verrucosa]|uniref:Probable imidazolonepropionase n=1 Tax=Triparma verrucosa TaxID=1606542 RepID=A0A9W7EVY4_9STRA|nr:hypothetical protein TrVE_jg8985 [Triparma verrucosa]